MTESHLKPKKMTIEDLAVICQRQFSVIQEDMDLIKDDIHELKGDSYDIKTHMKDLVTKEDFHSFQLEMSEEIGNIKANFRDHDKRIRTLEHKVN